MTGIEDFLNGTDLNLTFKVLNAFHGLGFMYSPNDDYDKLILDIIIKSDIVGIMEDYYLKRMVSLNDQVNDIKNEKTNLEKKIDYLERENKKLLQERDILFSSNSWKITKPLRWIKNKIL